VSDTASHLSEPPASEPTPAAAGYQPSVIRTRVIPLIALVMVAALLGLLAYSLFAPERARVGQGGRINASGALITENGRQAPDFTLTTFDGQEFRLSDQRGKIVIINFWASWCPPCRAETPLLNASFDRLGDDVVLIGVDVWDSESAAREFVEEYRVRYPVMRDGDGRVAIEYGVSGVPETFVIDADGRVIARLPGEVKSLEQLRGMVAEAR
jgi:cytochrome c biogenesis protein CcmG, thiol:disulfide interchange protein DsbE